MQGEIELRAIRVIDPPPDLTVSQWADRHRQLSSKSSAEPGQWRTSRAEYQRGIMDAVNDPSIETVVVMSSAQIGKTEAINNVVGYYIDQDPSPILVLQPTIQMAEAWSKDRLSEMIAQTDVLRERVADPKSRDGENTILHKTFPGGHCTMAGANSPASLASRPIRIVLCDEVDRYPPSAGTEGDPVNLARKRTTTFWNRKIILTSTPTIKGISRIESAYEQSDKRRYFVPCPHCGEYQVLKWGGPEEQYGIKWTDNAENVGYMCEYCGVLIRNAEKNKMVAAGEWRATAESNKTAGFHLNELYSPWVDWRNTVLSFLENKKSPETLQTWINTSLGETFEDQGEGVESHRLSGNQEDYTAECVPAGVLLITAGVDVQKDRLEAEFVGWGVGEESWSIDYAIINGDTTKPDVWHRLDEYITHRYKHETLGEMGIAITFIDSSYLTDVVYNYCKQRRQVYAIQGQINQGGKPKPIVPDKQKRSKLGLYVPVGVDVVKDVIYSRLRFAKHGPGYCHFPEHYPPDYFEQLTAETKMTKWVNNRPVKYWNLQRGKRNEALDCRVYAFAALRFLNVNFEKLKSRLHRNVDVIDDEQQEQQPETTVQRSKRQQPKRKGGFVNGWR